jgi:hypothetical protein
MSFIKMMTFCKSPKCTSSETLLSFQKGEISGKASQKIEKHLEGCEFCAAEVEFYNRYPQSEEIAATVEIPIPLYELAKALLSNKKKGSEMLDQLASENETLHLKEA